MTPSHSQQQKLCSLIVLMQMGGGWVVVDSQCVANIRTYRSRSHYSISRNILILIIWCILLLRHRLETEDVSYAKPSLYKSYSCLYTSHFILNEQLFRLKDTTLICLQDFFLYKPSNVIIAVCVCTQSQ